MKIFSAEQIYKADKLTIEKEQISSDMLMERAATRLFEWIHTRLQGAQVNIQLFCGIGNNGGDGIVLARHLKEHGYNIQVHVVNYSEKRSKDFLLNLERLKDRKIWPDFINEDSSFPLISPEDIVVDAVFGIGLSRPLDSWVANLIGHINASRAFVLSVDIPSGMPMDSVPESEVISANHVLSFQVPKLAFFLPQTGIYVDQWEILDIGLDTEFLAQEQVGYELMDPSVIVPLYRPRDRFSHKGTFGHALIVGGSYGKIGAVQLASNACLTVGSGLVTAFVPKCGYNSLQTALPEIMVLTDDDEENIEQITVPFAPDAVGIGVGMGTSEDTAKAFSTFLKNQKNPMVIDADGLNLLSKHPEMLKDLPRQSILTPHPKELERLIGEWKDDIDKLEKTKLFSSKNDCIVVIKGAYSITIYQDKGYINSTGNPGMATAGSGDVLTGMLTGLLAQGYEPLPACVLGVYLHGLAGDITAHQYGYEALKASMLVDNIGRSYQELLRPPNVENEKGP